MKNTVNRTINSGVSLVISYLDLRKAIGIIGTALPFVLAIGKVLLGSPGIQSSISAYYYTAMRDVFVGSLCAIAVFLFSYKGYDRRDDRAGNIAGLAALGVALFPTTPSNFTPQTQLLGTLHLISAAVFFLTLAYFSLVLFKKTSPQQPMTIRKVWRNRIYTVCGSIILIALALSAIIGIVPALANALGRFDPIFWLEAAAIVAFGISWMTKGEAILGEANLGKVERA
jgi:hypothetical protein